VTAFQGGGEEVTGALRGVRQVGQRATDLDRAIEFYRDVLDARFVARFDPPGLAFFDLHGVRLLLGAAAPSALLYFAVDDIDAVHQELRDRGVEFEQAPQLVHRDDQGLFGPPGEEEWMAFFGDPEGNLLAIASRRSA
jgi:methylmalonyl-CoA/ethylmalonyl-CoA epimerase